MHLARGTRSALARITLALTAALAASCGGSGSSPGPAGLSVTISPSTASLLVAETQQFTARVLNATIDTSVTWSIQEGSGGGTVSAGLYTAPSSVSTATTYHVVATANADTTKKATATVVVSPAGTITNMDKLRKLATKVGFFMHKSTGQNLIDGNGDGHGMQSVWAANSGNGWTVGGDRGWSNLPDPYTQDNIDNLYGPTSTNGVRLLNWLGGDNGDPMSKITAMDGWLNTFGAKLNASVDAQGHHNGYAMMKWCFADWAVGAANPTTVFNAYKAKLAQWKTKYPNVHFLHITVPVTVGHPDNGPREQMSDLMRNDSELTSDGLFDLADFESMNATTGQHDSQSYCDGVRCLRQAYTGDNCHPDQPVEEDFLGQKLIDFLYAHL